MKIWTYTVYAVGSSVLRTWSPTNDWWSPWNNTNNLFSRINKSFKSRSEVSQDKHIGCIDPDDIEYLLKLSFNLLTDGYCFVKAVTVLVMGALAWLLKWLIFRDTEYILCFLVTKTSKSSFKFMLKFCTIVSSLYLKLLLQSSISYIFVFVEKE